MMYRDDHVLWSEKYRPRSIESCVLPTTLKETFQGIVSDGDIPNLLLSGPAGCGKTTVAKALAFELDYEYLFLNASKDRGISTVREDVAHFASAKSLTGKKKLIIFDEADYLTPEAQTALRGLIEEFAANCSFIFTCNFKNKIIAPLHSRCSCIDFRISKDEKSNVLKQLFYMVTDVLDSENVQYKRDVLPRFILKFYPDFRRILNELYAYSKTNNGIDEGILALEQELDIKSLYVGLKNKKYNDVRDWVVASLDNDITTVFRKIYDSLKDHMVPSTIPNAIVLIHRYQYESAFSADQEITLLAFCVELMVECEFK